jgi:DNA-binding GntR family transcriptional regulator
MRAITPKRLVDDVYEQLRDGILSGELSPGTHLRVTALAEKLGVSRSPIREAVQRLTQERLALEEPRRGAVVASISKAELVRLYELREVLEGLAARLATERRSPELLATLKATLMRQEAAVNSADITAFREADMLFHQQIRDASANPELMRALEDIRSKVRIAMFTRVSIGREQALKDHWAIFKGMESGDAAASEQAARAHIVHLKETLQSIQQ